MNDTSPPSANAGLQERSEAKVEPKKFRLVRYFALTSLLGVLLVLAPLLYFYRAFATEALEQHETHDNVAITRIFASTLWPRHAAYVTSAGKLSKEQLRNNPEVALIRADVLRQMNGLSVVKVKIYDLHGLTVFSTDEKQIGEDKRDDDGVQAAIAGKVVSEIAFENHFDSFEKVINDRNLISSYIPIRSDDSLPPEGVFEVYSDVTDYVTELNQTSWEIVGVVLGSLSLLALAALGAFLSWPGLQMRSPSPPASASAAAAAAPAANPASVAVSAPLTPASAAAAPIEALDPLLTKLPPDVKLAWHALGTHWKLPPGDGYPCRSANVQGLQCYRANGLTLPQLRQLNRPGILTLHVDRAAPVYAVLVGLGEQTATLRLADGLHSVRLVSLGRWWRGDFATYWQPPADYRPELRDGSSGGAVEHLGTQLDRLEAVAAPFPATGPRILDAALRERVLTFQRSQGLKADGQPGPMTFMQLDSATGMNPVRLQPAPR